MTPKQRYRKRLKLQAALTRVLELLATNVGEGIPPDRTTALLAWQVNAKLLAFVKASELEPADLPDRSDLSRCTALITARRQATRARYRRG